MTHDTIITMTRSDLSQLIVDAVTETLRFQAPQIAPMNVGEAAKFTHLSTSTLYKMTSEGRIPHRKVAGKLYFDRTEISEWIAGHRVKTGSEIEGEAATRVALR